MVFLVRSFRQNLTDYTPDYLDYIQDYILGYPKYFQDLNFYSDYILDYSDYILDCYPDLPQELDTATDMRATQLHLQD